MKIGIWCLVVFLCVAGGFLYLERTNSWDAVGVGHMQLMFADTIGVLATSDCQNQGVDVYRENPCDPWHRVQVYGSATGLLGKVGLNVYDSNWVGWIVDILFWLTALLVMRPSGPLSAGLTLAILFSPAVLLGAERANIDLFLFVLLTLAIWLAGRSSLTAHAGGGIAVLAAAVVKLYPIAAAVGLVASLWRQPRKRWLWVTVLLLFGVWIGLHWQEVVTITKLAPKPAWQFTFGGELLFRYLTSGFSAATRLATLLLFLLVTLVALLATVFSRLEAATATPFQRLGYLTGLAILVFCFVATTNYDYRNVYFILLFPLLLSLADNNRGGRWQAVIWSTVAMIFFSLWREILPHTYAWYLVESVLAWLMFVPLIAIGFGLIGVDALFLRVLGKGLGEASEVA